MNKRLWVACLLVVLGNAAWGDSIDDAEAKRRGVPVGQVQAENALAAEKRKTADLEKQLAELKKQVAEAQGGAKTPSGGGAGALASVTMPAGAAPGSGLAFGGPRESSDLYDGLVKRYLDGDWATLAADLKSHEKQIKTLPEGNVADLTYIQQVLAESRPAWWDAIRTGKATQFKQIVWKQELAVTFTSSTKVGILKTAVTNGVMAPTLTWPVDRMDAADPLTSMESFYLNIPGGNGFTVRDQTSFIVWSIMGSSGLLAEVGADKKKALPPDEAKQYLKYEEFRQDLTAAYYGTPQARRAVCLRAVASQSPLMNGNATWAGVRPLGSAVMLELAGHADRYHSIALDPSMFIPNIAEGGPTMEALFSTTLVPTILSHTLTLDEDRHLRDLFRTLGDSNPTWNGEVIALQENLHWHLDIANDDTYAAERKAYFLAHKPR